MEPDVRYCTTTDGVRIAYTKTGAGPVYVSIIDAIVSHVELEWAHPVSKRHLEEEARHFTLVRLDLRGTGLSERVLPTSLDDTLLDIEAVVDRLQLDQFTLHANTTSTPTVIAYAARHPDQVSRMVIIDGFARYSDFYTAPAIAAIQAAAGSDWVTATEAIGAVAFGPGREESRMHGEFIRACIGPDSLAWTNNRAAPIDVSGLTSRLTMPVLVVRHTGLRWTSDQMTQDLVASIPDARLVTVGGTWVDDPESLVKRIAAFVYEGTERPIAETPAPIAPQHQEHGTAVVLFTDIVASTALTERMGDSAFRDASRLLDQQLRAAILDSGGMPVAGKLLGDGVMGTFASARQAIAAALQCRALSASSELELHIGMHAGDVIREDDNVYGGAVNIAARICALSEPGEVLVSDVVRGMARTSAGVGVAFEDRGEQEMKGVGDPIRVFSVDQRE